MITSKHWHSVQWDVVILDPQQSPSSKLHSNMFVSSSQRPFPTNVRLWQPRMNRSQYMSFDHNCKFQSSQCNIREITEFRLNISPSFWSSHYVVHLICVTAYFMESLIYSFKCLLLQQLQLLLSKSKQIWKKQFLWLQKINVSSEIQIEQKKKLRYSKESPWFPEYYIGKIGKSNCDQEKSNIYYVIWYNLYPYACTRKMNKLFKRLKWFAM